MTMCLVTVGHDMGLGSVGIGVSGSIRCLVT